MTTEPATALLTYDEIQAALGCTENERLARVIALHVPHNVDHARRYGWNECEGCDAGQWAEGPPAWPCSTIDAILGYPVELVRDPPVVTITEDGASIRAEWEETPPRGTSIQAWWEEMRETLLGAMDRKQRIMMERSKPELLGPSPEGHRAAPWTIMVSDDVSPGTALFLQQELAPLGGLVTGYPGLGVDLARRYATHDLPPAEWSPLPPMDLVTDVARRALEADRAGHSILRAKTGMVRPPVQLD